MSAFTFTSPDGKSYTVNGPDGATQEQAFAVLQQQLGAGQATPDSAIAPAPQTGFQHLSSAASLVAQHPFTVGAGMLENAISGTSGALGKLGGRIADLVTRTPNNRSDSWQQALTYQPRTEAGQQIQQLTGQEGNVIGSAVDKIPGVNTPLGQTLKSAIPEAATDISMVTGIKPLLEKLSAGGEYEYPPPPPPTPKQVAAAQAQDAGYVVPPTLSNPTFMNRLLGGLAGKAKVTQAAQDANQPITNSLAAKYLKQNPDAVLTPEAMAAIRDQAYQQGYVPLQAEGTMTPSPKLGDTLDGLIANATKAKTTFPGMPVANDGVEQTLNAIKAAPSYTPDGALSAVRYLRDQADTMFRQGNNAAAQAFKGAAKALEDDIESNLAASGKTDLLSNYRDARQLIARTYTIAKGLKGDTGDVDAVALANATKGKGYISDELKQITSFANNFRKAARVPQEGSESISPLDMYGAGATAIMSGSALPFAYPLTRAGLQSYLLGPRGQMRAIPSNARGLLQPPPPESLLGQ